MIRTEHSAASRSTLNDWTRALQYTKALETSLHGTILSVVEDLAGAHGDRLALIDENEQLTYRALVDRSSRYGSWALERDLAKGDVVCLLMPSCVDYVAIWFGITQVGCAVALINTNLVGDALAHSIRASGSRQVIVAASLVKPLMAIFGQLLPGTEVWVHGEAQPVALPRIDLDIASRTTELSDLPRSRLPGIRDRALLIYTSGTTGLPKGANVTHGRILEWSAWFAGMMDAQPEDRLYDCLPLYHSTGGVVAIGAMLSRGGSVLIRPRFSASRFWADIVEGDCTIFQYIGELCRYLTRSPQSPLETVHRLRLCCGNGLRGDVWEAFQHRFRIPRILEFYAATEGSVSLYNCEGKPGAIGRIPPFLRHRFPVELVRTDLHTGEPLRDEAGRCIRCEADEPGEAIGLILADSTSAARHFDGYTDADASARKILSDVFAPGDRWFRTGDLMRRDKAGYYSFVDRLGDTFRWKGENVSTTEVASVLSACRGVSDAVVYGVEIPEMEGRAGMAAITVDRDFSFAGLREHLVARLPDYAQPVFVRLCDQIGMTGTFKLTKAPLTRDSLSSLLAAGAIWFNDRRSNAFVECNERLLLQIRDGAVLL